jgi:hypothetical protein
MDVIPEKWRDRESEKVFLNVLNPPHLFISVARTSK